MGQPTKRETRIEFQTRTLHYEKHVRFVGLITHHWSKITPPQLVLLQRPSCRIVPNRSGHSSMTGALIFNRLTAPVSLECSPSDCGPNGLRRKATGI